MFMLSNSHLKEHLSSIYCINLFCITLKALHSVYISAVRHAKSHCTANTSVLTSQFSKFRYKMWKTLTFFFFLSFIKTCCSSQTNEEYLKINRIWIAACLTALILLPFWRCLPRLPLPDVSPHKWKAPLLHLLFSGTRSYPQSDDALSCLMY